MDGIDANEEKVYDEDHDEGRLESLGFGSRKWGGWQELQ